MFPLRRQRPLALAAFSYPERGHSFSSPSGRLRKYNRDSFFLIRQRLFAKAAGAFTLAAHVQIDMPFAVAVFGGAGCQAAKTAGKVLGRHVIGQYASIVWGMISHQRCTSMYFALTQPAGVSGLAGQETSAQPFWLSSKMSSAPLMAMVACRHSVPGPVRTRR